MSDASLARACTTDEDELDAEALEVLTFARDAGAITQDMLWVQ